MTAPKYSTIEILKSLIEEVEKDSVTVENLSIDNSIRLKCTTIGGEDIFEHTVKVTIDVVSEGAL